MPDVSIGVAIAVPEPYGSALQECRASFGDPLAATVPSHVTLLPPADVPAEEIDAIAARLGEVADRTAPFEVALRSTGTFRPVSPVVFVAVSQGVPETELLAAELRAALAPPEAEFPFHPHVTVAQHVEDAALDRAYEELADFTCRFPVEEFALYLRDDEAGWSPHLTFALGGGA